MYYQKMAVIQMARMFSAKTLMTNGRLLSSLHPSSDSYISLKNPQIPAKMSRWQIHRYGDLKELVLSHEAKLPIIQKPDEILVKVHAASINPIDVLMLGGYGVEVLNAYRRLNNNPFHSQPEFPLTLGRDFSGSVVATGKAVDHSKFRIGDEVWGTGNIAGQGCHAEYTVVSTSAISHKPKCLSHVEAASMPYVAATTWAAVCTVAGFKERNCANKRVLICGGSGGIGTFAIQLLKAWNAHVTTTCRSDTVTAVLELGADVVIDYTKYDVTKELKQVEGFDLIVDLVGDSSSEYSSALLKAHADAKYVTVVVPFLRNVDQHGFLIGLSKTAASQMTAYLKNIRWAMFMPSATAMSSVAQLVDSGKILPVIEKVFHFNDLPDAMKKVASRHNRGKTVIDMTDL